MSPNTVVIEFRDDLQTTSNELSDENKNDQESITIVSIGNEPDESPIETTAESKNDLETITTGNICNEPNELPAENINDQDSPSIVSSCCKWIKFYVTKLRGLHQARPSRLSYDEYFWSFLGAFISVVLVALLHYKLLEQSQLFFLIGSAGATAVILFGSPHSPSAQPRNLIFGHLIGAICGCILRTAIDPYEHSIACALAVALSIIIMQFTETFHPPGGATALIAVTIRPPLPWANFLFILMPGLTGAFTMLFVALIVNNMSPKRTYPSFWL